jgi:hypothetical protein
MGLSTEGVIFLLIAWGCILILVTYCFTRVIRSERRNK